MIKVAECEVWGFKRAIAGIRNSFNSRNKADSTTSILEDGTVKFQFGEKDLKLTKSLVKEGEPCRKFLRMIHVQLDLTAPLYWWKQFDTYKIGTTQNSESTMHTITNRDLKLSDFSIDKEEGGYRKFFNNVISDINELRKEYLETHDMEIWRKIIQLLPESYNQMRTVDLNYEVLLQMYKWRKDHKLTEWHEFCAWIEELPYMKDFLG